ncbi:hypothetical protein [Petrachloros mirabilis]
MFRISVTVVLSYAAGLLWCLTMLVWFAVGPIYNADARQEGRPDAEAHAQAEQGIEIPGVSFRVFLERGTGQTGGDKRDDVDAAVQTVTRAFGILVDHRSEYPRFDEAVKNQLLERVIVQPTVVNREGKAFPFLVARLAEPGRVKLLISASLLREQGYLGNAERLAPVLAREFQWVVSKADTSPKPKTVALERDFLRAPIRTNKEIVMLSGEERVRLLKELFETYLRTVDDFNSLEGQPLYVIGIPKLIPPAQPDSTTKFYDIRVREALQKIVREPSFLESFPRAVTSLLNGKIWNVAFVKIDQRDWATRTRVLPADKAVVVGSSARSIQPAAILVNTYRTADPDDPFYADTKSLPMGALSTDQLARVIAKEIEHNIVEKSQTGHVAQDAITAPK